MTKSPEGVSLYQHTTTRSKSRSARDGRIVGRPARNLPTSSAGAKLVRLLRVIVGGREMPFCSVVRV